MNSPIAIRMAALVLMLSLSRTPMISNCAAEDPELNLQYLIEQLQAWRASFVSLHLKWQQGTLEGSPKEALPNWSPPENWQDIPLSQRYEWIWAEHGIDLLESELTLTAEGGLHRTLEVFNADKNFKYRAVFESPEEGEEVFKRLTVRYVGAEKPISMYPRDPLTAMYWYREAMWLPEILSSQKFEWELKSIEELNSARCARVVKSGSDSVETLWLDLEHDCLVRRYLASGEAVVNMDYLVDEYQQLPNGIWFPERGRFQLIASNYTENSLWDVIQVSINQPLLDRRLERPQPEIGTIVDDNGMPYTYGISHKFPPENEISQETVNSQSEVGSNESLSTEWIWWTVGLSLVIAVLMLRGKKLEDQT